ncbi:terminase large subunit [Mucilaginibacter sp. UR6-1]|uniref:PBSX family phage terminase large subunit n=1 Tax=Mucilaginibacter sp. UR6-1 TaxID=1435643 RepID=UPI001E5767E2|nr:terminase large subunit [Mucilaginibacter sp. UR6-1]MCC8409778.1 terminase large subunit [Mucilaginibacter sp. UR6-1]
MDTSVLFDHNFHSSAHIVVNQGGTSSGKTYAILQVLFCLACETGGLVITVCGQDMPNLKAGAIRDALNIYKSNVPLMAAVKTYNKSDRFFEFANGSIIEFRSYDNAQDAKSGKRDYLFINEANGISWEVYNELALRTKLRVYIDYNPNTEFWVHDKLLGRQGVQLIISDHRHNPFVDDAVRQKIEALKHVDTELWKVYARGLTGKINGLILANWQVCEAVPDGARLIATGLDFGFTNDPTACLQVYRQNGELWVHELFYEHGLTNTDIGAKLRNNGLSVNSEVIADSAEPKSIEELRRMGWYISPAKKGADSVANSIDILQRYKINITRASTNLRNELGRYKWKSDRAGRTINEPVDAWNHLIDALRYVALNKLGISNNGAVRSKLPVRQSHTGTDPLLNGIL